MFYISRCGWSNPAALPDAIDTIIYGDARQHGCERQGVPGGKAARMEARAFVLPRAGVR